MLKRSTRSPARTPAVQQAAVDLLADEGNFIDLARSPIWIAQEHVIIA